MTAPGQGLPPLLAPTDEVNARPSADAVAAGIRVATALAAADPLDPHRPTVGQLVAAEVAAVERRHAAALTDNDRDLLAEARRERDEAATALAALREHVESVRAQRTTLAGHIARQAADYLAAGNYAAAGSHASWAASLAADAAALQEALG